MQPATMSTPTPAEVAKRSWSQIVTGAEPEPPPAPLRPVARGARSCLCHGEVLVMLGHYGWLLAFDDIDHPDKNKNGGRIYVQSRDVVGGRPLREGDAVTFFLYSDEQGLGAEGCRVSARQPSKQESPYRPGPGSLGPLPSEAASRKPAISRARSNVPAKMSKEAPDFVPFKSTMNVLAAEFKMPMVAPDGLAHVWEEFSKADVHKPAAFANAPLCAADVCAWLNDNFSDFSDSDSEEESAPLGTSTVRESWRGHAAVKDTRSASSSGSTSAGEQSDSEESSFDTASEIAPPPGLERFTIRPPPGLALAAAY